MWIDTERVADAVGWNLSQAAEERCRYVASACCFCGRKVDVRVMHDRSGYVQQFVIMQICTAHYCVFPSA